MSIEVEINACKTKSKSGMTLFDCAETVDIRVPTSCRKQGRCRECLVEVVEGMELLSRKGEEEQHLSGVFRLSCCTKIEKPEGKVVCHTLRRGEMRVVEGGDSKCKRDLELDPNVRLLDGGRVFVGDEEVDQGVAAIHGLAIDLGTTTVVVRLFDLQTGILEATSSFENPQRFGGSDVMARIQYDTDNKGRLLQRTLIGYLNHCIEDLGVDSQSIFEVVVAANSTMRDLFFGLDVSGIGQKPYHSLTEDAFLEGEAATTAICKSANRLGLDIHPRANVYGMPLISGHVGADAAACLLAIDIFNEDRLIALMDIGTNTELFVGNKDKLFAASCPAGPAFEGGAIVHGMPGLPGAIENVELNEDNDDSIVTVIGDEPIQGICGSGMIDLMSELLRTDKMNYLGRFEEIDDPFVVDPGSGVSFYESDINELAQAKGANAAGLQIAMRRYGISNADLDVFYLAGGFGRHIKVEAGTQIGLIPDVGEDKIQRIGNAAVEGACMALLSKECRSRLEQFVKTVTHVELETDPQFFDYFAIGCQFAPMNDEAFESIV